MIMKGKSERAGPLSPWHISFSGWGWRWQYAHI